MSGFSRKRYIALSLTTFFSSSRVVAFHTDLNIPVSTNILNRKGLFLGDTDDWSKRLLHDDVVNEDYKLSNETIQNQTSFEDATESDFKGYLNELISELFKFADEESCRKYSVTNYSYSLYALECMIEKTKDKLLNHVLLMINKHQLESDSDYRLPLLDMNEDDYQVENFINSVFKKYANSDSNSQLQNWLQEIDEEILLLESAESHAEALSKIALESLDKITLLVQNVKDKIVNEIYRRIEARHKEKQLHKDLERESLVSLMDDSEESGNKVSDLSSFLLRHNHTWEAAGFQIIDDITPSHALQFSSNLPIQTYQIRDDLKREAKVLNSFHKEQRRTRRHIGALDTELVLKLMQNCTNDHQIPAISFGESYSQTIDSSYMFAYNLKAIEALADKVDRLQATLEILRITTTASNYFVDNQTNLPALVTNLKKKVTKYEFRGNARQTKLKSFTQLATETATLESEASLANISLQAFRIKHMLRMKVLMSKFTTQVDTWHKKENSTSHILRLEDELNGRLNENIIKKDAITDSVIIMIDAVGKIASMKNESIRENFRIQQKSLHEVERARSRISMEATEERASESLHLSQINLLGEEASKQVVESIRIIFQNLILAMDYLIASNDGNQQIIFFVASTGFLCFCILTIREVIYYVFHLLRIVLVTPRLVREYRYSLLSKFSTPNDDVLENLIVHPDVRHNLKNICRATAKAKERAAPLQNLLLYGPPGNGKTMIAKAVASYAQNLPYVIMSGADVAPLGRNGPLELKKLLTWASTRHGGAILIIDEAESALGSRFRTGRQSNEYISHLTRMDENSEDMFSKSSSFSNDVLNVMLSLTGASSTNLMLILTTSNPSALDEAVLDRMDQMIYLNFLDEKERRSLLMNEFLKLFVLSEEHSIFKQSLFFFSRQTPPKIPQEKDFNAYSAISDLAMDAKTKNFSGRELKKILLAVKSEVYLSEKRILGLRLWNEVTSRLCDDITTKKKFK